MRRRSSTSALSGVSIRNGRTAAAAADRSVVVATCASCVDEAAKRDDLVATSRPWKSLVLPGPLPGRRIRDRRGGSTPGGRAVLRPPRADRGTVDGPATVPRPDQRKDRN